MTTWLIVLRSDYHLQSAIICLVDGRFRLVRANRTTLMYVPRFEGTK